MTLVPQNSVFISLGQARELRAFGMRAIINSYSRVSGLTPRRIPQAVIDFLNDIDAAADVPVPADVRGETSASRHEPTLSKSKMVTTTSAADALGCSERQVTRLLMENRLVGRKVNPGAERSPWLVDESSLDELVDERRAAQSPPQSERPES